MNKTDLRKLYKEKRAALKASEKDKLEDLILIQFQQLNIDIPAHIMTYAPFEKENEFDPQLITDYCSFKNPAQQLYYPVIHTADNSMDCVMVNDDTLFGPNKYGIDEPENGLPAFPEEIEMLIVPLLAFDLQGNRVGYGKGYYDRFLKECSKDALKIGFSFFDSADKIDDINEYDVKLDHCITPTKIYNF